MSNEYSQQIQDLATRETEYNWAAMFTAYANGSRLEDIAATFAIPMTVLRRAVVKQDWAQIASKLVTPPAREAAPETEARLAKLESNRAKNFDLANMLRDKLITDFTALRSGQLKIERAVAYKGEVHHTEVDPGPQDLVALANAAKTVAEMSYRALGDVTAEDRQSGRGNADASSITVILPTVVHTHGNSQPRQVEQVIDLRPVGMPQGARGAKALSDGLQEAQ